MPDFDDARAEEPSPEYLIEEQARFARRHRDEVHDGGTCICPPAPVIFSVEAPF